MNRMNNFHAHLLLAKHLAGVLILAVVCVKSALAYETFPHRNAWTRATPSVVWCNDPNSTTTLEVHIVGRDDVARIWFTDYTESTIQDDRWLELFDDGAFGDKVAGDHVFTRSDVLLPCYTIPERRRGWSYRDLFLRVELIDGTRMGNNYVTRIGVVDQAYRHTFVRQELGAGLSATAYAFFIEDRNNEVFESYPFGFTTGSKRFYEACSMLYSVLPDAFDVVLIMPGMQILDTNSLGERSPYCVVVSNAVQHIGKEIMDHTALYGSYGRLRSVIYQSFAGIGVFDHEIAHSWGAWIGESLGLTTDVQSSERHHWNAMSDICGQLGGGYSEDRNYSGKFSYLGNGAWELVSNLTVLPYAPLELYTMGLIGPEEVPPIHILRWPDVNDANHVTATSYETITIEDIMTTEGGERFPSVAESQKDFNLAFVVTQDMPYNEAAYAFFSLIAHQLTSKEGPEENSLFAPFYWATDGRATLETRLPLNLPDPNCLPGHNDPNCLRQRPTVPPLAHWQFEGNAHDSSGNGYHGTVHGDPTYVPGPLGQAIVLDGDDDYVSHELVLPLPAGTLAHWLKPYELRPMVCYYESAENSDYGSENENILEVITRIRDTEGHWQFWLRDGAEKDGRFNVTPWGPSAPLAQVGVWTHWAVTWDRAGDTVMYIDGVRRNPHDLTGIQFKSNAGIYHLIGRGRRVFGSKSDFPWHGAIDDVRIYNRALSTKEIVFIMNGGDL
ncbi:LamG domain-containing protein [Planctomycetota bacterium]